MQKGAFFPLGVDVTARIKDTPYAYAFWAFVVVVVVVAAGLAGHYLPKLHARQRDAKLEARNKRKSQAASTNS